MLFETTRSVEKNYLYTQKDVDLNFISHVHNSYEFIIALDGELECTVYQRTFVLKKGMAMLILPNHVHSYVTKEYSKSFLCIFSTDYVSDFYHETRSGGYMSAVFEFDDLPLLDILMERNPNHYLVRGVLYTICGRAEPHLQRLFESGGGLTYP